ncbi:MAG: hypothetical protein ACOYX5_10415 [Actinomycetota bacterium]
MIWVQVFLIFLGIPATMFVVITFVVMRLTTSRVPDGIAARGAAEPQARPGQGPGPDSQQQAAAVEDSAENSSGAEAGGETFDVPDSHRRRTES